MSISIRQNTTDLQTILDTVNALPEAGSGGGSISVTDDGNGNVIIESIGNAYREEWIAIADITTTEEVNKVWQEAQGFKRIMIYVHLPSALTIQSLYAFYTSDMWSSLYGFSVTNDSYKFLMDFEVVSDLGVTLQLNVNGNNNSVTNTNNGKILREGAQSELNGIGIAVQNNGLFPVGTIIKIRGLKA